MKRAVIIGIALMLALCAGPFALAQSTDPNIEAITFTNGKSNLKEKVYDSKAPCLVFFWDSNYFDKGDGQKNEYEVFKTLASKYLETGIELYTYDVKFDKGYFYESYESSPYLAGVETKEEKITHIPSVAMYNNGKQIDIGQGGIDKASVENKILNDSWWIERHLLNMHTDQPPYKYGNSDKIH